MHYAIRLIRMPVTLPRYLPMPGTREANRRIRQMDALMMGIVAARRALLPENRPNDLLTMLLEATDADTGQTMDNRQLRDEVTTLFVAGHETTANGMAWLGWLLAENPEIQQQLQAEVDAVGDAPLADMATLQRLELTGRVVDEGLRLYPPAWILGRRSLGPDTLAGYDITANSFLIVMPGLLHRNPKYWPRPERFDPDRFLPEVVATRPKGSYIPFGAGPRFCIGNQFALLEMKLLVARYMQRYRFETLRAPNGHEALVTLRPKSGIRLRMVAR
jgi:cytochrome P450